MHGVRVPAPARMDSPGQGHFQGELHSGSALAAAAPARRRLLFGDLASKAGTMGDARADFPRHKKCSQLHVSKLHVSIDRTLRCNSE
jgi:hypothetical protein